MTKIYTKDYSGVLFLDGLSHDVAIKRYQERRHQLLSREKTVVVVSGMDQPLEETMPWLLADTPLYQDPLFLYLTGLNQCAVKIILNPFSDTIKTHLFITPKNAKKEFWTGTQIGYDKNNIDALKKLTGFDQVHPISAFTSQLRTIIQEYKVSSISMPWSEPQKKQKQIKDNHFRFKKIMEKQCHSMENVVIQNLSHMTEDRLTLDPIDLQHIFVANDIVTEAFMSVCHQLPNLKRETEVAGIIKGEMAKRSWLGQSFPAIVACGKNARVLHYWKNNDSLSKNELLLMDFGCRYHSVVSDVSRTIPVSGTFNPLQKILYQIVLDAQTYVETQIKEGVTIAKLNDLCWDRLEKELEQHFLSKGGKMSRPYKKVPHNVGHFLAHAVHDGDYYRNYRMVPLKVGQVITNEPGLYGYFELEIDGDLYKETCGIRIEDNLVVTKMGCKNLTTCPKTIKEIEEIV